MDAGIFMPTEIVMRSVASLLPFAQNSKKHTPHQIEILCNAIRRQGWTNPVLIADDGILAGHGRIQAADKLGLSRVPCIDLSHLSPDERRALVISDNRIAEIGTSWDLDALKFETDYLRDAGFDLEATLGFDEQSLAEMFKDLPDLEPEGGGDPDAAPAEPEVAVSEPGDVWVCGDHRVMCGSSLDGDCWDRLMDGEQADACWTDPPYNVDIGGKNKALDRMDNGKRGQTGGIMNDKMPDREFYEFLLGMYQCVLEVMKAGAPIYVAHADGEGINFRTAFRDAGFKMQACIIWNKNVMVLGRMDFQYKHEPILYGWKPGAAHKWYGGRKNTTVMELGDDGPFTRMPDGRWQIKIGDSVMVVAGDATVEEHPSSVIFEPKPAKSGLHPTQKPVNLVARLLKQSAKAGDIVIDAFGGSGTTMIACEQLGMKARLQELDPKFVDVIVRRWEQFTGRRATHARTGELFPREDEPRSITPPAAAPAVSDTEIF